MSLTFEWDPRKHDANKAKHGVGFDEAVTVFAHPLGRIVDDPRHSDGEPRHTILGVSVRGRCLPQYSQGAARTASDSLAPDGRRATSALTMKKPSRKTAVRKPAVREDDILPEYDFSRGRPNPYAERLAAGTITVALDPDVALVFPDASSVNDALRALARIVERQPRKPRSKRRTA